MPHFKHVLCGSQQDRDLDARRTRQWVGWWHDQVPVDVRRRSDSDGTLRRALDCIVDDAARRHFDALAHALADAAPADDLWEFGLPVDDGAGGERPETEQEARLRFARALVRGTGYQGWRSYPGPILDSPLDDTEKGGCHWAVAAFCDYVETIGEAGKQRASEVRRQGREDWSRRTDPEVNVWGPWQRLKHKPTDEELQRLGWNPRHHERPGWIVDDGGSLACKRLAEVVWHDELAERWETIHRRSSWPVGVPAEVHKIMLLGTAPGNELDDEGLVVRPDGAATGLAWLSNPPPGTPVTTLDELRSLFRRDALAAVAAPQLLGYLFLEQHRAWQQGATPIQAANLEIEGGWVEVARRADLRTDGTMVAALRDAAYALQGICINTGGWRGGLLLVGERRAAPGRRARVWLTLGHPFRCDALHDAGVRGRWLVPWLDPQLTPDPVGNHTTYARQLWGDQALAARLTERSIEYTENGGVVLTDSDWRQIGRSVDLYHRNPRSSLIYDWRTRVTEGDPQRRIDGSGGPILVQADGRSQWRLAEGWEAADAHLRSQGTLRRRKGAKG
jgi:hypothetical protein